MAAHLPDIDDAFRALADPGRRRLLYSLNTRSRQTLRQLCSEIDIARQSVSKHLAVLEAAGLVSTVWRGREKLHYLNPAPSARSPSAGSSSTTAAERYCGLTLETDWKAGSPITLRQLGLTIADPEQVVLESDPYRRLSYAWHTFTPEWRPLRGRYPARTPEWAMLGSNQRPPPCRDGNVPQSAPPGR